MTAAAACASPRDTGYFDTCQVCGVPTDAGYFDVASMQPAPTRVGEETELARYELHPQYCGSLLYFAQYAEEQPSGRQIMSDTPGYEWLILCNNQPRAPYLPTSLILNPWGYNAFPIHLRLEEGCTIRLVIRHVGGSERSLSRAGGRLLGRCWYNPRYGGAPHRW